MGERLEHKSDERITAILNNTANLNQKADAQAEQSSLQYDVLSTLLRNLPPPPPPAAARKVTVKPIRKPVPYFAGRENILTQLKEGLNAPAGNIIQVLHGGGGTGKTQVVLKY